MFSTPYSAPSPVTKAIVAPIEEIIKGCTKQYLFDNSLTKGHEQEQVHPKLNPKCEDG
jgi:hypothetical protein